MNGATVSIWIICLAIFVIQAVTINVIKNILNTLEEMQDTYRFRVIAEQLKEGRDDETPTAE